MTKFIKNFLRDEAGAAAAEYVLILAIVGAGVGAGAYYLGGKINTALSTTGNKIESCSTNASSSC